MEQKDITLENIYFKLKNIERALKKRQLIKENSADTALISEKSLSKEWSNKDEDYAWKDL